LSMGAPGQFVLGRFSSRQERQDSQGRQEENLRMVFLALLAPLAFLAQKEGENALNRVYSIRKHPARPSPPMHLAIQRLLIGFVATGHQDLKFGRKHHRARQILQAQSLRGRGFALCFFHGFSPEEKEDSPRRHGDTEEWFC